MTGRQESQVGSSYTYILALCLGGSAGPGPNAPRLLQSMPNQPGWQWQKPYVQLPLPLQLCMQDWYDFSECCSSQPRPW
jgi:hypothetical protein